MFSPDMKWSGDNLKRLGVFDALQTCAELQNQNDSDARDAVMLRSNPPVLFAAPTWRSLSGYLHPDEPVEDYDRLKDALLAELAPQDIVESLWAEDVVSLVWESHRLRRVKRVMLEAQVRTHIHEAVERQHPTLGYRRASERTEADNIMSAYNNGDATARAKVDAALQHNPVSPSDRVAVAHFAMIDQMLAIDRAVDAADKRRDVLLSNLYARRQLLGRDGILE
jgi:hypothetical protein